MPLTRVIFFKESDGSVPVLEWLRDVRFRDPRGYAKCLVRIERLRQDGFELRRPEADLLRDGIYELRARHGRVNYRILYAFHGRSTAVLAHSCTKEDRVPPGDIDRAVRRMAAFRADPGTHTYEEERDDGGKEG